MNRIRNLGILALAMGAVAVSLAYAQPGRGPGGGRGPGRGMGQGFGAGQGFRGGQGASHEPTGDSRFAADRETFQFLLASHEKITRKVTDRPDGVETVTESTDPEIVEKIQEHVVWMKERLEKGNPIRMRDPLFAEIFRNREKIRMEIENTDAGVRVTETSDDAKVVALIQAHAKAVSGFVDRGFAEAMKQHSVPGTPQPAKAEFISPAIRSHGAVVRMPEAAQQPRDGSRLVVDVTKEGDPAKLNPGIEKVARFVNIYRGAGKEPATAQIAIVLHGDATLCVLNADAYAERFETKGNPNLDLLHELHEQGVAIYVCGQSLAHEEAPAEEVVAFVDVAVSALTSLVNLQADGYAYVPLLK